MEKCNQLTSLRFKGLTSWECEPEYRILHRHQAATSARFITVIFKFTMCNIN